MVPLKLIEYLLETKRYRQVNRLWKSIYTIASYAMGPMRPKVKMKSLGALAATSIASGIAAWFVERSIMAAVMTTFLCALMLSILCVTIPLLRYIFAANNFLSCREEIFKCLISKPLSESEMQAIVERTIKNKRDANFSKKEQKKFLKRFCEAYINDGRIWGLVVNFSCSDCKSVEEITLRERYSLLLESAFNPREVAIDKGMGTGGSLR